MLRTCAAALHTCTAAGMTNTPLLRACNSTPQCSPCTHTEFLVSPITCRGGAPWLAPGSCAACKHEPARREMHGASYAWGCGPDLDTTASVQRACGWPWLQGLPDKTALNEKHEMPQFHANSIPPSRQRVIYSNTFFIPAGGIAGSFRRSRRRYPGGGQKRASHAFCATRSSPLPAHLLLRGPSCI